jgi:NADH:ubiquinone reductase (H+-translocating)
MQTLLDRSDQPAACPAPPPATDAPFASAGVLANDECTPGRHRVVIVGGGAGGIRLAALLGRTLGRRDEAEVVVVDQALAHVWKPLLHEVAAGTLPEQSNQSSFLQLGRRHGYRFHLGRVDGLDRAARRIWLDRLDDDDGEEIAPRRWLGYDTLVMAVGSIVNDFGTTGVAEHATRLDSAADAERFHRRLLAACARAEVRNEPVEIVIVGGGATGVELAAELHEAVLEIAGYGAMLSRMPAPVHLTVIEGTERLLGGLPPAVAERAQRDLVRKDIKVRLGQQVTEVSGHAVTLANGDELAAHLCVWAAGIQGPPMLRGFDDLELNQRLQLVVTPTLQTTRDPAVFAFGDCAAVDDDPAPPTAQAAQQQADYLARALRARLEGRTVSGFRYRSQGALVSLGSGQATGSVANALSGKSIMLHGPLARLAYWALQRKHLATLHGTFRAALTLLGGWLTSRGEPRIKLH